MTVTKFHINSKGDPAKCTAKVRCPYSPTLNFEHYASKEAARAAFEERMAHPKSEGARLLLAYARVHREVNTPTLSPESDERDFEKLSPLIRERDELMQALRDLSLNDDDGHSLAPSEYPSFTPPPYDPGASVRMGMPNTVRELLKEEAKLYGELVELSEAWLGTLSTSEVKAVSAYSEGSQGYAMGFDGRWQRAHALHKALEKAPRIAPTVVYSGLSSQTRDLILDQIEAGAKRITVGRALSTSINPAMVNSFATPDFDYQVKHGKPDPRGHVALEIEATHGGCMVAGSSSPQELEFLLPPGDYEVLEVREGNSYRWNEKNEGVRFKSTIRLRCFHSEE